MKQPRRFSLEKDFMSYTTDDLVYGFMRCLSTTEELKDSTQPQIKFREYLPLKVLKKEKKTLAGICNCSTRTIDRKIQALREANLIKEEDITVKSSGKEYTYPSYVFPYDYDGNYKILEKDLVKYLVYTRNSCAIRVYLYLLNAIGINEHYVFTVKELTTKALGYSELTKTADELVKNILQSFNREGLIKFHTQWFDIENPRGDITKTQRMVIDKIITDVNELEAVEVA